ncbi:MAG: hypothetical protein ACYDHN_02995 [Solirubrobacteraceae bacterium]
MLDIGCGFGDTTQRIAAIVGAAGEVSGADVSPRSSRPPAGRRLRAPSRTCVSCAPTCRRIASEDPYDLGGRSPLVREHRGIRVISPQALLAELVNEQ